MKPLPPRRIFRTIPLLLCTIAPHALAGLENLMPPLMLVNPMGMPSLPFNGYTGYGIPFGGYGNSFGNPFANPFANPFSNPFANPFSNPLGLNTLGALGSLGMLAAPLAPALLNPMGIGQFGYPAMQVAPNMLSYGHYGQYGGGPFGGNPYLQRDLPNPLTPPAFTHSFSNSMPTLPFSNAQGTLPLPFNIPAPAPQSQQPQQPQQQPPQTSSPPLSFPAFGNSLAISPAPGVLPGMGLSNSVPMPAAGSDPWGAVTGAQYAAPAVNPAAQGMPSGAPQGLFFLPFMMPPTNPAQPVAAPQPAMAAQQANPWLPAQADAPAPQEGSVAAGVPPAPDQNAGVQMKPLDPASFLQLMMKPAENPAPATK